MNKISNTLYRLFQKLYLHVNKEKTACILCNLKKGDLSCAVCLTFTDIRLTALHFWILLTGGGGSGILASQHEAGGLVILHHLMEIKYLGPLASLWQVAEIIVFKLASGRVGGLG
jgi:hypothetical protein